MLDKHLVVEVRPQANEKNIVRWGNYRITILQDRLFRLERSKKQKFRDEATQSIWYRDMLEQRFSVSGDGEVLKIVTEACTLIVKDKREDCRIEIDGKTLEIDNSGNLLGTSRTLDGYDGDVFVGIQNKRAKDMPEDAKLKLENGVCSLTGVAVFDDVNSLTLSGDGEVKPHRGDGSDEYIFAYGDNYRAAIKALYMICGRTPLIPRFALGNWWSKNEIYNEVDILTFASIREIAFV